LQTTTKLHQQPLLAPLTLETSISQELTIASNLEVFESNGFKLKFDEMAPPGSRIKILSLPFSKSVHFDADDVNELASMLSEYDGGGSNSSTVSNDDSAITGRGGNKDYLALKNLPIGSSEKILGKRPLDLMTEVSEFQLEAASDTNYQTAVQRENGKDAFEYPIIDEHKREPQTQMTKRLCQFYDSRPLPRLPKLVAMFASRACRSSVMIGTALTTAEMRGIVNRLDSIEQPWNCPHGRPTVRHLVDVHVVKSKGSSSAGY
jgi:DNA mismatch repair ATPase MutL